MPNNRLEYLTANDWVLMSARSVRLIFTPGQSIIEEGARGEAVYVIRKGTALVVLAHISGKKPLAKLGPGDICGDMGYLEKGNATASVVAEEEVEVDRIPTAELDSLFQAFPGLASRFYRSLAVVLARRLRDTSAQLGREFRRLDRNASPGSPTEPPQQR